MRIRRGAVVGIWSGLLAGALVATTPAAPLTPADITQKILPVISRITGAVAGPAG